MDHMSQHISYTINNIPSYDHMSKMIVNLVSSKGDRNDESSQKFTDLQNYLIMIIVDTSEKD